MKKTIFLIALSITAFAGWGQNLVPNGDFEQYSGCPNNVAEIDSALYWISPILISTGSTPDYFNQCSTGVVNVPNSVYGYQQAHSGGAFCGIVLWAGSINDAREYIEVPLTSPLIANQCYHFEMYINAANIFDYSSDDIAAYFSDTLLSGYNTLNPLPFTPQINNTTGNFPDTLSWMPVSGNYTATGGESYLIIGNFKWDINTDTMSVNNTGNDYVYVYIDDVSLSPCTGIVENQNEAFYVYPNPVKDELRIKNSGLKIKEINIFDMEGRKVLQQIINNQSSIINIKSLNDGIYFIEINDGKNVYRKKLLKK